MASIDFRYQRHYPHYHHHKSLRYNREFSNRVNDIDREYPRFSIQLDSTRGAHSKHVLQSHTNIILVSLLTTLCVVFFCILAYLILPMAGLWIRSKVDTSQDRIQKRYETIENWLISKKVRSHCTTCEQLQERFCSTKTINAEAHSDTTKSCPRTIQQSPSHDTADTVPEDDFETNECPICYDTFQWNDIVSWSPNSVCSHVMHHECIKEWLLYHDNCPCCRVIFLPVDKMHFVDDRKEDIQAVIDQRSRRLQSTYYCFKDGLVALQLTSLNEEARFKAFVGRNEKVAYLALRRQSRARSSLDDTIDNTTTMYISSDNETNPSQPAVVSVGQNQTIFRQTETQSLPIYPRRVVDIELCLQQLRYLPSTDTSEYVDRTIRTTSRIPQPLHISQAMG